jgi:nicotinamide phosphoribosyltransferase
METNNSNTWYTRRHDPNQLIKINDEITCTRAELEEAMYTIPMDTDSYKVSMAPQYPKKTKRVRSYIESRGGRFNEVMHLQQPLVFELSRPVTQRQVDICNAIWLQHGEPFPKEMWDYIVRVHGGVPPVSIRTVAEGLVIPTRNVLTVIENTDEEMPDKQAIVTWCETKLLRTTWYMSTVGTMSWQIKQVLKRYYEASVDPENYGSLAFRLHDFGSRGVSSSMSAAYGGSAHLMNFLGTDTGVALPFLMLNYGAAPSETGFSIAAAEHSTVTSWGREGEMEAAINMARCYANPNVPFAFVSDSFDIIEFVKKVSAPDSEVLKILKERNAIMVIRPDSGDPVATIMQILSILERNVGSTKNKKGYKILNYFRIIWGDGINKLTIESILRSACDMGGYSAENLAFGMGGALLQICNRDDQQYAMKCSAIELEDGTWREVYKQPAGVTFKASKKGRVMLYKNADGELVNLVEGSPEAEGLECMLHEVLRNGEVLKAWHISEVRANTELPVLQNAKQGHSSKVYAPLA